MSDARNLYLDLMKRVLLNLIFSDEEQGLKQFDKQARIEGREWPAMAHTMIGWKRLENIQRCVEDILAKKIPGDLIETGVWRGGAIIFMRAVLKAYDVTDRCVWGADSFAGLPKPDVERFPADEGDQTHTHPELAVSLDQVRANFEKYGLLDDQVRFLPGWFRDTLPTAPIDRLVAHSPRWRHVRIHLRRDRKSLSEIICGWLSDRGRLRSVRWMSEGGERFSRGPQDHG